MIGMKAILNVCGFSDRGGFFYGAKASEHFGASVQRNRGNVNLVSFAKANASNASRVIGSNARVSDILSLANLSKVLPSVIRFVAVDVINFISRLFARHHHKDNAMSKVSGSVYADSNVSARADVRSYRPCISCIPSLVLRSAVCGAKHFSGALFPSKLTSVGIVGKDCTQKVCGWYFMLSHFVLLNRANRLVDEGVGAPLSAHFNTKKVSYGH